MESYQGRPAALERCHDPWSVLLHDQATQPGLFEGEGVKSRGIDRSAHSLEICRAIRCDMHPLVGRSDATSTANPIVSTGGCVDHCYLFGGRVLYSARWGYQLECRCP